MATIRFWDGKVFGTTFGAMDRLSMSTYDGTDLGSNYGTADGKFDVLFRCDLI